MLVSDYTGIKRLNTLDRKVEKKGKQHNSEDHRDKIIFQKEKFLRNWNFQPDNSVFTSQRY